MNTNGVHHTADEDLDQLYAFWPGWAPAPAPLPEARSSVNVRIMLGAHEVQVTLRDHDETALLRRLGDLLKRRDVHPIPKPAPRGNWPRKGR